MSLAAQYKNQYQWRNWAKIYSLIPEINHKKVLDLGCAIGDQSHDMSTRGAFVTGIDCDQEFIQQAIMRNIPHTEFYRSDLRELSILPLKSFDIIWCSFTIAYFTDIENILTYWSQFLKDDGTIILTEISGLLDFKPLPEETHRKIQDFYADAFANRRYDFYSANKIPRALDALGFEIHHEITLEDQELSPMKFNKPEIIDAWRNRFNRMGYFRKFIGQEAIDYILAYMEREQLKTDCKVKSFIARKRT